MKVGLCTGCFDLLHEGHLYFLGEAMQACDYLVVAVNTDRSVARLKGPKRPVHPLEDRLLNLATRASFVDGAFVPFDGSTDRLVMAVRPDVVIKGYDQGSGKEELYFMRVTGWKSDPHSVDLVPVVKIKHLPGFSTSLQLGEARSKTNA